MASEQKAEGSPVTNSDDSAVGFVGKIEATYRDLKEHAETYPYVWASYAVVYGGFGLYMFYRWRKLRKTEDRVRVLQERLRQLAKAEESAAVSSTSAASENASAASENASATTHVNKPPQ